jgi:serine/threonine protein kinase
MGCCASSAQPKAVSVGGFVLSDQVLGSGSFSTVFVATKDGREYACKVVNKKAMPARHLKSEIETLNRVANHSNVIQLYHDQDGLQAGNNNKHYLVMELMGGSDLFDLIKHWQTNPKTKPSLAECEADAAYVCSQVGSALCHCHENRVIHRDLKPENLMLLKKNSLQGVKIADFGFATVLPESGSISPSTIVGSPGYLAPETRSIFKGQSLSGC